MTVVTDKYTGWPYSDHMNKKQFIGIILLNFIISASLGIVLYKNLNVQPTKNELIYDFYKIENAVYVSPHGLRKSMDAGKLDYTIVDLRSRQEYENEHIIGAINIPAYSDPDTSAYDEVDRIVGEFRKLPNDKEIVVYCYSMPCMTGRKIGLMLANHDIFVKHLGIGWNEWRYYWNLWNHELEWTQTDVKNYIQVGSEPGIPQKKEIDPFSPCTLDNAFGC